MRQLFRALACLAPLLLALLPAQDGVAAAEQRRVALVIGNGAYAHTLPLVNPPNDARAVAASLRELGFEVIERIDLDYGGMRAALAELSRTLEGADSALFYYAGHGLQVGGRNFLVPIDAALEREADLYLQALGLDDVLRLMEAAVPTRLVILDACRNNPLTRSLARSMGATRSVAIGRGLAKLEAGAGTLIAYATAPDQVALDGTGQHSPFTAALVEEIAKPGLEVRQVLTRVRKSVIENTNGQQVPWDTSSLTGDFYFTLELNVTVAPPAAPASGDGALELAMWQSAERLDSEAAYRAYTGRFCPDGAFCALAEEAVRRLTAPAPEPPPAPAPLPEPTPPEPDPPGPVAALPPDEPAPPPAPAIEPDLLVSLPRDAIREVQAALTALGYDTGGSDGVAGRRTRAAVEAWQRGTGRAATGVLTAEERTRLLVEAAPRLAALTPPPAPAAPKAVEPAVGVFEPPARAEPGRRLKDCETCPELVVVPAGRFTMGSPAREAGRTSSEGPQVEIAFDKPFAIGRFEVTFAEWEACVAAGGCRTRPDDAGFGRGRQPVINVSWNDARSYVDWLSRQTGRSYALPSEAQWEYAARGGSGAAYPWGEELGRGRAVCDGCGSAFDYARPAPVGSFGPNRTGLHDPAGNVWEWVQDCWRDGHAGAPRDGRPVLDGDCGRRTVKGGSYSSRPHRLRSAAREAAFTEDRAPTRGFRVMRGLD